MLLDLARQQVVPIVGEANYKDGRDDAVGWLRKHRRSVPDVGNGCRRACGIDYGVYGVPETFLIDQAGMIRYKHIGPCPPARRCAI